MYKTTVKLKSTQFIGGKWHMTNRLIRPVMDSKGTLVVSCQLVEFTTDSIKYALANIELDEIEELHITKIY